MRPRRSATHPRHAAAICLLAASMLLTGCNEFGWNPLDPNNPSGADAATEQDAVNALPQTRLSYSITVFEGGSSIYDEYVDQEKGQIERRRDWSGPTDYPARGGLVSVQATGQGQVQPAEDPADVQYYWPSFAHKTLVFEKLFQSENSLGRVLWRRFTAGGNVCVMFSQTLTGAGNLPRRKLAGYYCAPAGIGLSEGQAETVVQSVRVWDGQS